MFRAQADHRLKLWKKFREEIGSLPIDTAIQRTNNLWSTCPFTPFYLDPLDPPNWPDPWNLVTENYYCDLAKVLGIVYTLHLTTHQSALYPEIRTYLDKDSRYTYHIAYLCQGKYVLNLTEGEVVNKEHITQNFKLKHCYTAADLQLEKY